MKIKFTIMKKNRFAIHTRGPLSVLYAYNGSVVKGPLQTLDNRLIVYKGA